MGESYFFDDAVLTTTNNADDSNLTIAGLRGITITAANEIAELYTADSILRDVVKQYEHNVNVDIDYAFFDVEATKQWLGGQGSTSATSTTDTSDPLFTTIEVVSPAADNTSSVEKTAEVENVVFPEWPMVDGSYGEFEEYGLSGSGRSMLNLDDTGTV